jgi:hypothetical protein
MTRFLGFDSEDGFKILDADDIESASMQLNQDSVVLGELDKDMVKSMTDVLKKAKCAGT